jgi:PKHD-type hydroxylase
MLVTIDGILHADELVRARTLLGQAAWVSGRATAGALVAQSKNNQQIAGDDAHLPELRQLVITALQRSALFRSAALPLKLAPPSFNRHSGDANFYGMHVDNAMHIAPDGSSIRSDVSCTLFLSEPESYEGGELVIEDVSGRRAVKLKAGSIVVYSSGFLHEVAPVTAGERLACFMFIQSKIRSTEQRRLLFDMDMAVTQLKHSYGDGPQVLALLGIYHNLLRLWGDT